MCLPSYHHMPSSLTIYYGNACKGYLRQRGKITHFGIHLYCRSRWVSSARPWVWHPCIAPAWIAMEVDYCWQDTPGAGKSTLATALAQCGFALVSDDWTYVSRTSVSLVAHGLLAPVKLLPDVARFFPRLHDFKPGKTLNGEMAYELDPQMFAGVSVKDVSKPRWIFFLERTAARGCHFVPCRPDFVTEFFEQSAERLPSELTDAQKTRSTVIRELSQCPSWILRTGESPAETASALSEFVTEVSCATA